MESAAVYLPFASLRDAQNQRGLGRRLACREFLLDTRDLKSFRLLVGVDHFEQGDVAAAEKSRPIERISVLGRRLRALKNVELLARIVVAHRRVGQVALQLKFHLA